MHRVLWGSERRDGRRETLKIFMYRTSAAILHLTSNYCIYCVPGLGGATALLSVVEQQYELKSTCPGSAPTALAQGEGTRFAISSVWKEHRFSDSQKKKQGKMEACTSRGSNVLYGTKKNTKFLLAWNSQSRRGNQKCYLSWRKTKQRVAMGALFDSLDQLAREGLFLRQDIWFGSCAMGEREPNKGVEEEISRQWHRKSAKAQRPSSTWFIWGT